MKLLQKCVHKLGLLFSLDFCMAKYTIYLVAFQACFLRETLPTSAALVGLLGRMSPNVKLKVCRVLKFFPAKCARKLDRIFGVFSFHMSQNVALVQVGFLTAGKCTWETGSFSRSVNGVYCHRNVTEL